MWKLPVMFQEAVISEVFLEENGVSACPATCVASVGRAAVPSSETSSAPPPPIASAEAHVEAAGHRPARIVAAVAAHVFLCVRMFFFASCDY